MIKDNNAAIKNEAKEQKDGFLGMLLGTLSASLLENVLAGRGVRGGDGVIQAGGGTNKAG